MRVALYWVPSLSDPLYAAGCAWLGRDAETGAAIPQPALPNLAALTADARRYGFHATLLPPVRLATGWEEFTAAARHIANTTAPFSLPPLAVQNVDSFLALRETTHCPPLHALADRCVLDTLRHRLRPDAAELARRRAAALSPRQDEMLERYGYPYVLDAWFFHLTLSRRLDPQEMTRLHPAAIAHFHAALAAPQRVKDICICTQRDGDFLIAERLSLRG